MYMCIYRCMHTYIHTLKQTSQRHVPNSFHSNMDKFQNFCVVFICYNCCPCSTVACNTYDACLSYSCLLFHICRCAPLWLASSFAGRSMCSNPFC